MPVRLQLWPSSLHAVDHMGMPTKGPAATSRRLLYKYSPDGPFHLVPKAQPTANGPAGISPNLLAARQVNGLGLG